MSPATTYFICLIFVYFRGETRTLTLPFIKTPDQLEPVEQLMVNLLQYDTWNITWDSEQPIIRDVSCSSVSRDECFETALFMSDSRRARSAELVEKQIKIW